MESGEWSDGVRCTDGLEWKARAGGVRDGGAYIAGAQRKAKAVSERPEKPSRQYPLNLIDALMNCETYQSARQVIEKNIPADFDERLRRAATAIKDDRAYDFLVLRFRDGCTLQMIAEKENLSRERIRQLLEKYIKRLRHPDILRFLDCGIENIPERTSKTILDRLNAVNR